MTSPTRIAVPAAVAAAGLTLLATNVLGGPSQGPGPGPPPPAPDTAPRTLDATRVAGPAGKQGGDSSRIVYLETNQMQTIEPGPGHFEVKRCPTGSRATNGYFYKTYLGENGEVYGYYDGFGLSEQGSAPRGFRKWVFNYDNVTPEPIDRVTFGIICDKDG